MLELACKTAVFYFNKKHLEDQTIPMWIVKTRGRSYYVNHVSSNMPWSTKESPDHRSTKGSIKFKNAYLTIDDDNNAEFSPITDSLLARVRAITNKYTRILIPSSYKNTISTYMKDCNIKHTPFKIIRGSCGSSYTLCDILNEDEAMQIKLCNHRDAVRILMPNEPMYKVYDDPELMANFDADDYYSDIDDEYVDVDSDDEVIGNGGR
jgi:hypothetical protein